MERYVADPADATPSTSFLKPTTIRLVDACRVTVRTGPTPAADEREKVRAKLAPNGVPPADVTVPLITAPLLATNDTDADEI
jgi:hypothetical protein